MGAFVVRSSSPVGVLKAAGGDSSMVETKTESSSSAAAANLARDKREAGVASWRRKCTRDDKEAEAEADEPMADCLPPRVAPFGDSARQQ